MELHVYLISIILGVCIQPKVAARPCITLDDPANGYVVCDSLFRLFCSAVCHPGYRFESKPAVVYMCGPVTGEWFTYPVGSGVPWPDCVPDDKIHKDNTNKELSKQRDMISHYLTTPNGNIPSSTAYPTDQESRFHHLYKYIEKAQKAYEYRASLGKEAKVLRQQARQTGIPQQARHTGVPNGNQFKKDSRLVLQALTSKVNKDLKNYIKGQQRQIPVTSIGNRLSTILQRNSKQVTRGGDMNALGRTSMKSPLNHEPVIVELPSKPQLKELQLQLARGNNNAIHRKTLQMQPSYLNKLQQTDIMNNLHTTNQEKAHRLLPIIPRLQNLYKDKNVFANQRQRESSKQLQINTNKLIIQQLPQELPPYTPIHSRLRLGGRSRGPLMFRQLKQTLPTGHETMLPLAQLQSQFFQNLPSVQSISKPTINKMKMFDSSQHKSGERVPYSIQNKLERMKGNDRSYPQLSNDRMTTPQRTEPINKQSEFPVKQLSKENEFSKELQLWNNTTNNQQQQVVQKHQQNESKEQPLQQSSSKSNNQLAYNNVQQENQTLTQPTQSVSYQIQTTSSQYTPTQTQQPYNEPFYQASVTPWQHAQAQQQQQTPYNKQENQQQPYYNEQQQQGSWSTSNTAAVGSLSEQENMQQAIGRYQINNTLPNQNIQPSTVSMETTTTTNNTNTRMVLDKTSFSTNNGSSFNNYPITNYYFPTVPTNYSYTGNVTSPAIQQSINRNESVGNPVVNWYSSGEHYTNTSTMTAAELDRNASSLYDSRESSMDNQTIPSPNRTEVFPNILSNSSSSTPSSRAQYLSWYLHQLDTMPPPRTPQEQSRIQYLTWLVSNEKQYVMYKEWQDKQLQTTPEPTSPPDAPKATVQYGEQPEYKSDDTNRDLYIAWLAKHRMKIPDYALAPPPTNEDAVLTRTGRDSQPQKQLAQKTTKKTVESERQYTKKLVPKSTESTRPYKREKLFYFPIKKTILMNYLLSKDMKNTTNNSTTGAG